MTYEQETPEQYAARLHAAAQVVHDTKQEYDLIVEQALRGSRTNLTALLLSAANAGYLKGRNA
jgi:hypothetical protein